MNGKKILYICERPYPLYRTIVKAVSTREKPDIILSNHTSGIEKTYTSLKKSELFSNVLFFDDIYYKEFDAIKVNLSFDISNLKMLFKKLHGYIKLQRQSIILANNTFPNGKKYDEIYVNDATSTLNLSLFNQGRKVIWVEHAKDAYKPKKLGINGMIFRLLYLLEKLHITYALHGFSKYAKCIEVNDNSNLHYIPKGKEVVEWNIDKAIAKLTEKQKNDIFSIYAESYDIHINKDKEYNVLLTAPLEADGLLDNYEAQETFYKNLIRSQEISEDTLIVKAHPRDEMEYNAVFPRAIIVDKSVSAEILAFSTELKIQKIISINTSSLAALANKSKETIQLLDHMDITEAKKRFL